MWTRPRLLSTLSYYPFDKGGAINGAHLPMRVRALGILFRERLWNERAREH